MFIIKTYKKLFYFLSLNILNNFNKLESKNSLYLLNFIFTILVDECEIFRFIGIVGYNLFSHTYI